MNLKKTMGMFLRGTLKTEAVTYGLIIPVLALFALVNFRFVADNALLFWIAMIVAGSWGASASATPCSVRSGRRWHP
jgi:uncharacterized membrane-anchored protein